MAKLYPPEFDESSRSAGEKQLFHLFRRDTDSGEWLVLHSLGLSQRASGPYGEIDFVVIVPGEGILCLEVKAGRVACEAGVWTTLNRFGTQSVLKKSPIMQARDAMFALREKIQKKFGETARESQCPIGCAVVFTDVTCPPATPEFERSDIIDVRDLETPISKSVLRVMRHRLRQFQRHTPDRIPTVSEAKSILNFLRPDFELVVSCGLQVNRSVAKLISLTEEQYSRLDELEENPRCLFEGAAGTGKTLLAVEYSKRAVFAGKTVSLLCYNRLLGSRLEERMRGSALHVGTYHSAIRKLIVRSEIGEEFVQQEKKAIELGQNRELFDELYPYYAELALEEVGPVCDVLVLDEAQDLSRKPVLDVLNRFLRGGLSDGRWAMFGDFTRQALYANPIDPIPILQQYASSFTRAKLSLNCRNTRRIAEETVLLAGFDKPPFRMGHEMGLPVDHRYWRTPTDLAERLGALVSRLCADGIAAHDIVILSPKRLGNSSLRDVTKLAGLPLREASPTDPSAGKSIAFSTIHSFKGLESTVVVVIDIDQFEQEEPQSLLYVAMSRARAMLVLFIKESAKPIFETRIRESMLRGLRT